MEKRKVTLFSTCAAGKPIHRSDGYLPWNAQAFSRLRSYLEELDGKIHILMCRPTMGEVKSEVWELLQRHEYSLVSSMCGVAARILHSDFSLVRPKEVGTRIETLPSDVLILGGWGVHVAALPFATHVHLNVVHKPETIADTGETFFPKDQRSGWSLRSSIPQKSEPLITTEKWVHERYLQ